MKIKCAPCDYGEHHNCWSSLCECCGDDEEDSDDTCGMPGAMIGLGLLCVLVFVGVLILITILRRMSGG